MPLYVRALTGTQVVQVDERANERTSKQASEHPKDISNMDILSLAEAKRRKRLYLVVQASGRSFVRPDVLTDEPKAELAVGRTGELERTPVLRLSPPCMVPAFLLNETTSAV